MEATLSFRVSCNDPRPHLQVKASLADQLRDIDLSSDPVLVEFQFSDSEDCQQLVIELSGKNSRDTRLDAHGDIVSDVLIAVEDVMLDGVRIDKLFQQQSQYWHRYNRPDGEPECHAFYGTLGCNGRLMFEFTTPAYLWLLENM